MYTRLASVSLGKPCPTKVNPDRASSSSLKPLWDRIIFGLEMPLPRSTAQKLFSSGPGVLPCKPGTLDPLLRCFDTGSWKLLGESKILSRTINWIREPRRCRGTDWGSRRLGCTALILRRKPVKKVQSPCRWPRNSDAQALDLDSQVNFVVAWTCKGPCLSQVGTRSLGCRSWGGWCCAEPRNPKIHRQAQAGHWRGSAQDGQHPTT